MTLPTLAEVMRGDAATLDAAVAEEGAGRIEGALAGCGVAVTPDLGASAVLGRLEEGLGRIGLREVLVSGWKSLRDLQAYRDPARHPPDETAVLRVGKHAIPSEHRPKVEVTLNDMKVGELVFPLKLALEIASAELVVRDGRIWKVLAPEIVGAAELSFEGFLLKRSTVGPYHLPGGIEIEGGLPIPALPGAMV
jgi:hypothetical protein